MMLSSSGVAYATRKHSNGNVILSVLESDREHKSHPWHRHAGLVCFSDRVTVPSDLRRASRNISSLRELRQGPLKQRLKLNEVGFDDQPVFQRLQFFMTERSGQVFKS